MLLNQYIYIFHPLIYPSHGLPIYVSYNNLEDFKQLLLGIIVSKFVVLEFLLLANMEEI